VFILITGAVCQDLSITLSMNPSTNGGKIIRGSTVEFRCTVDKNILGHGTVEWYRRQGVNRYQLGSGMSINSYLTTAPRYSLAMESQTSSTVVYRLAISGVCLIGIFTLFCSFHVVFHCWHLTIFAQ